MVESTFNKWTLTAIFSSILLSIVFLLFLIIQGVGKLPLFAGVPILLLMVFIIIWLVYGELRNKAIKVIINSDSVTAMHFLGLGAGTSYAFKEIEGYKISRLPSEYQEYEYLYLFIGRKKIIRLSQFYHSNYAELKKSIISGIKNLGEEPFSITREIKEIFIA